MKRILRFLKKYFAAPKKSRPSSENTAIAATELQTGDYYIDPNGLCVFTEQYLRRRGYCCKNGCRHCPYGYLKS